MKSSRQKTDTIFDKYDAKMEAINDNIETKYPKLAPYLTLFKDTWRETFPNSEKQMASRMKERKKIAKL